MSLATRCLSRSSAAAKVARQAGSMGAASVTRATTRPFLVANVAASQIRRGHDDSGHAMQAKTFTPQEPLLGSFNIDDSKIPQFLQGKSLEVMWSTTALHLVPGKFYIRPLLVRDNCACAQCRNPHSGQKTFLTTDIPSEIEFKNVRQTEDGLEVEFSNDFAKLAQAGHKTTLISWETVALWSRTLPHHHKQLIQNSTEFSLRHMLGVELWDRDTLEAQVRKIDYNEFMQRGPAFWDAIKDIIRLGIVFLKNVPREEKSVLDITTTIANVKETFYGRTFDVQAKPEAENVAYTSGDLGLHQDLLYLESPPFLQILHCMDNSCAGGDSTFSDGERVARLLLLLTTGTPLEDLLELDVSYGYRKNGHFYHQDRPVIEFDSSSFCRVIPNWSPPFQAEWKPRRHDTKDRPLQRWVHSARLFQELINDPAAIFTHKMEPGECVLFDNRRIMHGRTAFDTSGGSRWLRGAYISYEDFFSKAAYLPESERGQPPQQWFPLGAMNRLRKTAWFEDVRNRVRRHGLNYKSEFAREYRKKSARRAASQLEKQHSGEM